MNCKAVSIALLIASFCLTACKDDKPKAGNQAADPMAAAGQCEHQIAKVECPFCNPKLIEENGFCKGHGVPEALCTRCNKGLIPAFKAKKDWCKEHDVPESQCTICDPDLLKKGIKPPDGVKSDSQSHLPSVAPIELSETGIQKAGIRVEEVASKQLTETLTLPARVSFNMNSIAQVGSPLTGRVVEIKAKLGDQVKKDDVLLMISSPEFADAQGEYLQRRAAAIAAEPAVKVAQGAYERGKALYDQGHGVTLADVQKREAEYRAAQAAKLAVEAAVKAAENRLRLHGVDEQAIRLLAETGEVNARYLIRAPLAGRIVDQQVTLGELVNPERSTLLAVADMTTAWVLVDVPEAKLGQVRIGAVARIILPGLGDKGLDGVVSYIADKLDPATRSATARVEVKIGDSGLRPGMFCEARITVTPPGNSQRLLVVPAGAVQTVQGLTAIFVTMPDRPNTFETRFVRLGASVDGVVSVLSGLSAGEKVVVENSFLLKADLGKADADRCCQ